MFFLPFSIVIFIILILLLPILFVLFSAGAIGVAFQKLGMSPGTGVMFFFLSLIGGMINFPIREKSVEVPQQDSEISSLHSFFFGIKPHFLKKQVLAINLGGCILPVMLCLYLLPRAPIVPTIICTVIMIIVSKFLARPTPGIGIAIPAFIPPIVSAILALLFVGHNVAAPVAYISGVLGVLIGADLMNIKAIQKFGRGVMSIGGAGVFDGIFLVGIIAVLIT
jgi:uncharacterized membrane protein